MFLKKIIACILSISFILSSSGCGSSFSKKSETKGFTAPINPEGTLFLTLGFKKFGDNFSYISCKGGIGYPGGQVKYYSHEALIKSSFEGSNNYNDKEGGWCTRHWTGSKEKIESQFRKNFILAINDLDQKSSGEVFVDLLTIGALGLAGVATTFACPVTAGASCVIAIGSLSLAASMTTMLIYTGNEIQNLETSLNDAWLKGSYWSEVINDVKAKNPGYMSKLNLFNGDNLLDLDEVIINTLNKN